MGAAVGGSGAGVNTGVGVGTAVAVAGGIGEGVGDARKTTDVDVATGGRVEVGSTVAVGIRTVAACSGRLVAVGTAA